MRELFLPFRPEHSLGPLKALRVLTEARHLKKKALLENVKVTETLSKNFFPEHGYKVCVESWDIPDLRTEGIRVVSARSMKDNGYIGTLESAEKLCLDRGIKPEISPLVKESGSDVCSIGYCEKEDKWYGWSHRAIWGFKEGDVLEEGNCAFLCKHPDYHFEVGHVIKDQEARRVAIAFAEGVS